MKTKKQKSNIANRIKDASEFEVETKMVFYGKAGTGKTTLAASFPKPILFLDCAEKGTDSIRDTGAKVLRCETFEDLELIYWALKKKEINYKTVVIDTVSQAQDLAIREFLGVDIKESELGSWGTMRKQDWHSVSTMMKDLIHNYRDLPMNVIFIAHDRSFNMDEDEGDESTLMPTIGPRLMPSVVSTLNASVSFIGNTFIRERTRKIKKKVGKKLKIIEKVSKEYCLRIGPHSVYTTKIRKPKKIPLPEVLVDPSYDDIIDLIAGEE